jgi:hypothetical protein
MSFSISKIIVQIHEQSSHPLPTFRFKFLTRLAIIAARIVMGLVKGARFVPDNL